jgi:LuxR family maltose regulon positive regulatory protein
MTETSVEARGAKRERRIVERPRLTVLLDGATSRIRMLVAPAGFGKTTLARQWSSAEGRTAAWYPARPASADVAVLCSGLAVAAAEVLEGCDRRVRERLGATLNPSEEAALLAEMLAEDLDEWPSQAWLVLDDYHLLSRAREAELFVERLVACSPLNLLIASRSRPSWVSSRMILYGEVFELGQNTLAMSREEASEVLVDWREDEAAGLISLADGWPAVIGLAGIASAPVDLTREVPETLYDFFAEEVFQSLDCSVQQGLASLAVAPSLDIELASVLIGDGAASAIREGLRTGILDEHGSKLTLHPLARHFLEARGGASLGIDAVKIARKCLASYRSRADFDASFEVISRFGLRDELDSLLLDAIDTVLEDARLATLGTWLDWAASQHFASSLTRICRAELSIREGRSTMASVLADEVLGEHRVSPPLRFRALMIGARSAHLASDDDRALLLYRRAKEIAPDAVLGRHAVAGEVMCAAALELEEAKDLLEELRLGADNANLRERVLLAERRLSVCYRFGRLDGLAEARKASELVGGVSDPLARCSFRSIYSALLAVGASYDEALEVADALIEDATSYKVDLALPYAYCNRAAAELGRGRYPAAHRALDQAGLVAGSDVYAQQNIYCIRARLLLQQRCISEASALEPPDVTVAVKGMRGEVVATRGLVLACAGRLDEAEVLAAEAAAITRTIETNVLAAAIRAMVAVKSRRSSAVDLLHALVDTTFEMGGKDLLIGCCRASPELLAALLAVRVLRERVASVLARSGDPLLAHAIETARNANLDVIQALSPREHEVYELLIAGASNRQIAQRLFISEATVKVHVHHVYDKVGVRSRSALALAAAQERARQAAPATTSGTE